MKNLDSKILSSHEKLVALVLLHYIGDDIDNCCWPSIKTIALNASLSVSTVKRCLNNLQKKGFIKKIPRFGQAGRRTSSIYQWIPENRTLFNCKNTNSKRVSLTGRYKNIDYQSCLELSFILWCEHENIPIKRYDSSGVKYVSDDGVDRFYYPDFIINETKVIEIKSDYIKNFNFKNNVRKFAAADSFFDDYEVILNGDIRVDYFYYHATKLHKEKEDSNG